MVCYLFKAAIAFVPWLGHFVMVKNCGRTSLVTLGQAWGFKCRVLGQGLSPYEEHDLGLTQPEDLPPHIFWEQPGIVHPQWGLDL